jgi:glyoxylase-like metal-dependent hydrolase (beta-lactamase superfamily II)
MFQLDFQAGFCSGQCAHGTRVPEAIIIPHNHLDHIGGLESLFYRIACNDGQWLRPRLFVPAPIIERLHGQLGNDRMRLA